MQKLHNFAITDHLPPERPGEARHARHHTAARALKSCMPFNSRCGLHQVPPKTAQVLSCMPVPCISAKSPRQVDETRVLAALGFLIVDSCLDTSKTLVMQKLVCLLATAPVSVNTPPNACGQLGDQRAYWNQVYNAPVAMKTLLMQKLHWHQRTKMPDPPFFCKKAESAKTLPLIGKLASENASSQGTKVSSGTPKGDLSDSEICTMHIKDINAR